MSIDHITNPTKSVLRSVWEEREAQDIKWGEQNHPNGTGAHLRDQAHDARERCEAAFRRGEGTFRHILDEEVAEAFAESNPYRLREELIQVAAVAVAWVEKIDRGM